MTQPLSVCLSLSLSNTFVLFNHRGKSYVNESVKQEKINDGFVLLKAPPTAISVHQNGSLYLVQVGWCAVCFYTILTHTHTHTHTFISLFLLRGHKRVIVASLTFILHIVLTTFIPNNTKTRIYTCNHMKG